MKMFLFKRMVWVLVLAGLQAGAQNIKDDLRQVSEYYASAHIKTEATYNMYAGHTGGEKIQSMPVTFYIWEKLNAFHMDDVQMFSNEKFLVTIDHEFKTILVNKATSAKFEKTLQKELLKLNMDSLFNDMTETTLLGDTNGIRTWKIRYKKTLSGISDIAISFDTGTFRLHKVVFHYSNSFEEIYGMTPPMVGKTATPCLEIIYNSYSLLNEAEKDRCFYAADILTLDRSGNATPKGPYKQYELANYYIQK